MIALFPSDDGPLLISALAHDFRSKQKQQERLERIQSLSPEYHSPISPSDAAILAKPASAIISSVNAGKLEPQDILVAYGKKALVCRHTNLLRWLLKLQGPRAHGH